MGIIAIAMKILSFIGWSLVAILSIDALGFIAWAMSGQYPIDGFYVGTITAHLLRLVL